MNGLLSQIWILTRSRGESCDPEVPRPHTRHNTTVPAINKTCSDPPPPPPPHTQHLLERHRFGKFCKNNTRLWIFYCEHVICKCSLLDSPMTRVSFLLSLSILINKCGFKLQFAHFASYSHLRMSVQLWEKIGRFFAIICNYPNYHLTSRYNKLI